MAHNSIPPSGSRFAKLSRFLLGKHLVSIHDDAMQRRLETYQARPWPTRFLMRCATSAGSASSRSPRSPLQSGPATSRRSSVSTLTEWLLNLGTTTLHSSLKAPRHLGVPHKRRSATRLIVFSMPITTSREKDYRSIDKAMIIISRRAEMTS